MYCIQSRLHRTEGILSKNYKDGAYILHKTLVCGFTSGAARHNTRANSINFSKRLVHLCPDLTLHHAGSDCEGDAAQKAQAQKRSLPSLYTRILQGTSYLKVRVGILPSRKVENGDPVRLIENDRTSIIKSVILHVVNEPTCKILLTRYPICILLYRQKEGA